MSKPKRENHTINSIVIDLLIYDMNLNMRQYERKSKINSSNVRYKRARFYSSNDETVKIKRSRHKNLEINHKDFANYLKWNNSLEVCSSLDNYNLNCNNSSTNQSIKCSSCKESKPVGDTQYYFCSVCQLYTDSNNNLLHKWYCFDCCRFCNLCRTVRCSLHFYDGLCKDCKVK